MKIGYDAKRFFSNFTGLGNYSRFIVDAVARADSHNDLFLFSQKIKSHPEFDPILQHDNVRVVTPGSLIRKLGAGSIWRSWGLSYQPVTKTLDIFHGLSHELPKGLPARIRKVVTVHDLIFFRYPHFYSRVDRAIYKIKVRDACHIADKVVAISTQTAQDVVDFLGVDKSKITVIHQGCNKMFRRTVSDAEKENIRKKYNLPPKFILNVGTIEERKNILLLVKALAGLSKEERIPTVIVGKATSYKEELLASARKYGILNDIIFIHNASFNDFPSIYQMATMFVYPSLFEGFGIPIIEAIESGIPVITSTGSCFMEAAGPASIFVDPHDDTALAQSIRRILSDDRARQRMVRESADYIKKFSSETVAKDLLDLYKELTLVF